jgi:hypothetical protein
MEHVFTERTFLVRGLCVECNEDRGSAVVIDELRQDADIWLYFPACGHRQTFTADQKKKMREALAAEGVL